MDRVLYMEYGEGPSEEPYLGEESYKTSSPSSPDTCITSTLSCVSEDLRILRGNFEMTGFRDQPELTLALIKPDGMKYLQEIKKRLRDDGFNIVHSRRVWLSPEDACNFYHEHYGRPYFPLLVAELCEGPIQVYVLRRKDALERWKWMCGPDCSTVAREVWPDCLRATYDKVGKGFKRVCHASETAEKAREEIRFFFPNIVLDANYQQEKEAEEFLKEKVNPTLFQGLVQLCKNKPLDPILWLGTWLLKNNPNKPKLPGDVALTPT